VVRKKENNICSRKKVVTCCLPVSCGLISSVFLITALYAAAHPQQECWSSKEPYLNVSDTADIGGKSFDVSIQNCGVCGQEIMRCNYPIEGVKTSEQLIDHVNKQLDPLCGSNGIYRIKANVEPELDVLAKIRMPSSQTNMFFDFIDQKKSIEKCKVKRPFSKSKYKQLSR
jgi:hypothetical protein